MSASPDRRGAAERSNRPTTERVQGIFSTIAPKYDLFGMLTSFGIDRGWRSAVVRAAELTSESKVLDLCAGTGEIALVLAGQGRPAEVVATDFVPEMLDIAREKASTFSGPTKLTFTVADAQALPFEDASFDVATVGFGVRNLSDREANYAEVLRVLKPGGRYVILEFSHPPLAPWRWVYHLYLRVVIPAVGGLLTGDRPSFVYLNESIRSFPTEQALAEHLLTAGFSEVSWKNRSGGIVAIHTAVK